MADNPPLVATALAVIGGSLIAVDGLLTVLVGWVLDTTTSGDVGLAVAAQGLLTLLFGAMILGLAFLLLVSPGHHVADGLLILFLVLLANITSLLYGGFVLGSILAFIGGVAACLWSPPSVGGQAAVRRAQLERRRAPAAPPPPFVGPF